VRNAIRTSTTNRPLDSAVRRRPDQTHTHLPQIHRTVGPQLDCQAILEHRPGRATNRIEALHNAQQTRAIRDVRARIEPGDTGCASKKTICTTATTLPNNLAPCESPGIGDRNGPPCGKPLIQ